jgi:PAS domain S-box-containing protein/putative nucleotidyltransferase with HDIG domain
MKYNLFNLKGDIKTNHIPPSPDKEKIFRMSSLKSEEGLQIDVPLNRALEASKSPSETLSLLKESEEKYRNLVERASDGICLIQDSRIEYCNQYLAQMYGGPIREIEGKPFFDFIHPDDVARVWDYYTKRMSGIDVPPIYQAILKAKDGSKIYTELNAGKTIHKGRPADLVIIRDFTKHRQIEQDLQAIETKYRELFSNMLTCAVVYEVLEQGEKFIIKDINLAAECTEKVNRYEVIGRNVLEIFPGVEEFGLLAVFKRVYETGTPEHFPLSFYKDNRISGWKENYIYKLPSGEIVAVYEDITERKNLELEKAQSSQFLQTVQDSIPIPIYIKDTDGKFLGCNSSYEKFIGVEKPHLIGKNYFEVVPQKSAHVDQQKDLELFSNPGIQTFESQFISPSGIRHDIVFHKSTFLNREGSVGGLIGAILDVTENKQKTFKLKRNEEQYRALLENSFDCIMVVDANRFIRYVTPSVKQVLGYSLEELIGHSTLKFLHSDDIPAIKDSSSKGMQKPGSPISNEVRMRHKDGSWHVFESVSQDLFSNPNVQGTIINFHDVTDHKKAEASSRINEARLQSLLRISQYKAKNTKDFLDYALEEVIQLTESKVGYIYLCDEMKQEFTLNTWSKDAKKECSIVAPQTVYTIDKTGIWGEVVRQRKPVIVNDFEQPHPLKKGYPEGHPRLHRFMSVPVFSGDKIVAVVGMANKVKEYDEADLRQTNLLMNAVWKYVEHQQSEELLKNSELNYRYSIDHSPVGIKVVTLDAKTLYINQALANMCGYDSPEELMQVPEEELYTPEAFIELQARKLKRRFGKFTLEFETSLKRKNGGIIYVSITISEVFWNGSKQHQVIYQDITAQKMADLARLEAQQKLKASFVQINKAFQSFVDATVKLVEMRDPYTAGHQSRVSELATAIGAELKLSQARIEGIKLSGLVHDIGKIYVPAEILSRSGELTDLQYEIVKTHVVTGYDILKTIEFPWPIAKIIRQHHERLDGSGYPDNLTGNNICLEARIIAVADVTESMTSHRPYRSAHSLDEAISEISDHKGTLYDPDVVDVCIKLFRESNFKFTDVKKAP